MTADLNQPMCSDCRENDDGSLTCAPAMTLCLLHELGPVTETEILDA